MTHAWVDTYIKKVLVDVAFFVRFLEEDVAQGVDDENFSILRNDPLPRTGGGRTARGFGRDTLGLAARLLGATAAVFLLGLLLLHAPLLPVHRHGRALVVGVGRGRRRGCGRRCSAHTGDAHVVAPRRVPRELDVALDKLLLPLPAHIQDEVVDGAAAENEQAQHDGAQAGPVAVVVVVGALPEREAVGEEVVVPLAGRAAQDVGDEGQAGLALRGLLDGGPDLGRSGRLRDVHAARLGLLGGGFGAVRLELLLHLVRVQRPRLLAVCLVDVILRRAREDAQDVVKRSPGVRLVRRDLVADAEDLAVCAFQRPSVYSTACACEATTAAARTFLVPSRGQRTEEGQYPYREVGDLHVGVVECTAWAQLSRVVLGGL